MSDENQTDEPDYVDPNSGLAPQPGGYAGLEGVEKGHGIPSNAYADDREPEEAADMPDYTEEQRVEMKATETQAAPSEDAEDPDGEGLEQDMKDPETNQPSGQEFSEEEQVAFQAAETQGTTPPDVEDDDASGSEESAPADEEPAADEEAPADEEAAPAESGAYDPGQYTVDEVNEYLDSNPDQRDAVVAAERAGKNRKGITGDE